MSRLLIAASLVVALGCSGAAFAADTTTSTCASTQAKAAQAPMGSPTTTSMADTSSDMGNAGSGASSASIGTGTVDKTGVNTPCAPGTTGQPSSGAVPAPANAP